MKKIMPFREKTIAMRKLAPKVERCIHCGREETEKCPINRGCCPTHHQSLWNLVNVKCQATDAQLVARGWWLPKKRNFQQTVLDDLGTVNGRAVANN